MKKLITFLLVILVLFTGYNEWHSNKGQSVNALIGDISFTNKYGKLPDAQTDEKLRISTHLEYVENLLRKKDISDLSPFLQQRRLLVLNLLHIYREAAVFPHNYDYPDNRIPCFIDRNGNICAVGYLVEQTAGRETAEKINKNHQYDELLAMNDRVVDEWINSSGLTKEECAMIQPSYGGDQSNYNHISNSYGVPSAIFSGVNLSLSTINVIQATKGAKSKVAPIAGILSGIGQVTLGVAKYPKELQTLNGPVTNESEKTLSLFNIGFGTTTIILSTWNLFANKPKDEKDLSWNVFSFSTHEHNPGIGLNIIKRL